MVCSCHDRVQIPNQPPTLGSEARGNEWRESRPLRGGGRRGGSGAEHGVRILTFREAVFVCRSFIDESRKCGQRTLEVRHCELECGARAR